jgi:hypothetical protein
MKIWNGALHCTVYTVCWCLLKRTLTNAFECKDSYTENSKKIFPEMRPHVLSPNYYIYVSVSHLYINSHNRSAYSAAGKIGVPIVGIY